MPREEAAFAMPLEPVAGHGTPIFRMSRSCLRVAFSRRNRFNFEGASTDAGFAEKVSSCGLKPHGVYGHWLKNRLLSKGRCLGVELHHLTFDI
jgi:hypothetical protein